MFMFVAAAFTIPGNDWFKLARSVTRLLDRNVFRLDQSDNADRPQCDSSAPASVGGVWILERHPKTVIRLRAWIIAPMSASSIKKTLKSSQFKCPLSG
jgi:hypothetical protein